MVQLVETVPNFSEGRDPSFVEEAVAVFAGAGAEVLDASLDPDHNRSVITAIGPPDAVLEGSVRAAVLARERIDMRHHRGVHPRIGGLDVLPFVPLVEITWEDTVALALEAAERISSEGVPVLLYGEASPSDGQPLSVLRKGGFEGRSGAPPKGRPADYEGRSTNGGPAHSHAHPTAGTTCVGVREVLLAWNVDVAGIPHARLREIASQIREKDGGFKGLRALALELPKQGRLQISMNLENPKETDPMEVFLALEGHVLRQQGKVVETEVIGMLPDALSAPESCERIKLRGWRERRILSRRVAAHLEDARFLDREIDR